MQENAALPPAYFSDNAFVFKVFPAKEKEQNKGKSAFTLVMLQSLRLLDTINLTHFFTLVKTPDEYRLIALICKTYAA